MVVKNEGKRLKKRLIRQKEKVTHVFRMYFSVFPFIFLYRDLGCGLSRLPLSVLLGLKSRRWPSESRRVPRKCGPCSRVSICLRSRRSRAICCRPVFLAFVNREAVSWLVATPAVSALAELVHWAPAPPKFFHTPAVAMRSLPCGQSLPRDGRPPSVPHLRNYSSVPPPCGRHVA